METASTILREYGGVARLAVLNKAGLGRHTVERAVERGSVIRLRKGVYALPEVPQSILTAARHGGELACGSALRAHNVWVGDADEQTELHIWVGPSGRQHRHPGCSCRVHHEHANYPPRFGVARVVVALQQYAACASEEMFFAALESAMRQELIGISGIQELRAKLPDRNRWIVDLAGAQADSGLESLIRFRLHKLGIALRSQVRIPEVGIVDFLLAERIILEADGRQNHEGTSLRHKDLVRDAKAAKQGYETLRFDYAMILHDWETVLAAILGRMRALGLDVPSIE